jgi:acyl-CoA reductase-like NAD-dependent aldehyde dehydrogenase
MVVTAIKVGGPLDPDAQIEPTVSQKQWDRVQSYT